MPENPRLPGMPGPSKDAIEHQEAISAAFVQIHQALAPLLTWIPGRNTSISLTRTVLGDKVSITLKPGADK
jgi:hypothetical protein